MNPIAPHIKDILTALDAALKDPNEDKQRLRRARAHVESAYYILGGTNSQTAYQSQQTAGINVTAPTAGIPGLTRPQAAPSVCICPVGSRDRTCPATSHTS
jgi:hypothetical protein